MSFTNLEDPSLARVRAEERAKLAAFRASGKLSSSSYYMSRANDRGGVFFEFAAADRARLAEAVKDIYDICVWLEPAGALHGARAAAPWPIHGGLAFCQGRPLGGAA